MSQKLQNGNNTSPPVIHIYPESPIVHAPIEIITEHSSASDVTLTHLETGKNVTFPLKLFGDGKRHAFFNLGLSGQYQVSNLEFPISFTVLPKTEMSFGTEILLLLGVSLLITGMIIKKTKRSLP